MGLLDRKCPFADNCKLYDKESETCNKTGGEYYGPGRMAGCGRDLTEKGKESKWYKPSQKKKSVLKKVLSFFDEQD